MGLQEAPGPGGEEERRATGGGEAHVGWDRPRGRGDGAGRCIEEGFFFRCSKFTLPSPPPAGIN